MVMDVSAILVASTTCRFSFDKSRTRTSDYTRRTHLPRSLRCRLKDLALHLTRQIGVNRGNNQFRYLVSQRVHGLLQILLTSFDLILTRQEEQDITFGLSSVDLENSRHCGVNVVGFGLLSVKHVDGETTTGDVEGGCIVEELCKLLGVEGRRRDEKSEFWSEAGNVLLLTFQQKIISQRILKFLLTLTKPNRISVLNVRSCASSMIKAE